MTGQDTSLRFPQLKEKQQTGSKVRCHLLTHGTKAEVAHRLTRLIEPFGEVLAADSWMPEGFAQCDEAQLHTSERIITDPKLRTSLLSWWLAVPEPEEQLRQIGTSRALAPFVETEGYSS